MQRNNGRNERAVVTYAALIAQAHKSGLSRIETAIVQMPTKENGSVAVMRAAVTIEAEGRVKVFHGTGDASPENVARGMRTCLLRRAERRSKARALRDAVNVGAVAAEELADFTEDAEPIRPIRRETPDAAAPILGTQENAIRSLCKQKG